MEGMASAANPWISAEQYVELERADGGKFEYENGAMYAMSGASPAHARIQSNSSRALGRRLEGSLCSEYSSDLRIAIPETGTYTYADLTVVCGPLEYDGPRRIAVVNPKLILEVLSPATERADRGKKFKKYQTLASLEEYVLVAQDEYAVDVFTRGSDGQWLLRSYTEPRATVELASIGVTLRLEELYDRVSFDEAER